MIREYVRMLLDSIQSPILEFPIQDNTEVKPIKWLTNSSTNLTV